ncbi:hypothetical protein [Xenorhabdus taiwanensis]|uniref:Phage protein n=1 Tax=Xenorhabdus taiwanensis TaxID=3085177 RepID=A0ABN7C4R6_9GAMM|nr:hypothetical protein TCT1_14280 [Xenorhabdus sp. TCT-1]BET97314.1 hypothetical protein TCT1_22350 [Xenorhabdus sp. TCT-1]
MTFTDLTTVIEEARWMRTKSGHHRCVIQQSNGEMVIREERKLNTNIVMYSTYYDRVHTVLPEVR